MPPPKSISVECLITDGDENSLDAARPDLFSLKLYAAITYTKKCIITADLKIMKFNIFTGPRTSVTYSNVPGGRRRKSEGRSVVN